MKIKDKNVLRSKINKLETKYGTTTAEMVRDFKAGLLDDTADFARWLILAKGSVDVSAGNDDLFSIRS